MELTALFVVVAGFVATIVIGLLTRCTWPAPAKVVVAGVVSFLFGLAELYAAGATVWAWSNIWPIMAATFMLATAWFQLIAWKVPGLKDWWDRNGLKPKGATTTQ